MDVVELVANGPGLGDGIVLSAIARAYARQRPWLKVVVTTPHPELYQGNPDVVAAYLWDNAWHRRSFPEYDHQGQGQVVGHQIQDMIAKQGLVPPPRESVRPYVRVTPKERVEASYRGAAPYATVNCVSARWTVNRDWLHARWAQLVAALRYLDIATVQVGGMTDPPLATTFDVRGFPLRQVAAIMANAAVHVCPITGTMHLAAAVGTRAVVVFSGREDPAIIAYPTHDVLTFPPPQGCSPCWLTRPCPHAAISRYDGDVRLPCMMGIEVEDVARHVDHAMRSGPIREQEDTWATDS